MNNKIKICPVCKSELLEENGIYECKCGYTEINYTGSKPKDINVPLNWVELDEIVLALRLVNKAYRGNMNSGLELKMSSMKAKKENREV